MTDPNNTNSNQNDSNKSRSCDRVPTWGYIVGGVGIFLLIGIIAGAIYKWHEKPALSKKEENATGIRPSNTTPRTVTPPQPVSPGSSPSGANGTPKASIPPQPASSPKK